MTERYAVREPRRDTILKHFHVTPTIDAFSTHDTAKCTVWWGPGSPHGEDAFEQDWEGHTLWMNPPFSMLYKIAAKIVEDQAHAILVMPDWRYRVWHKQLMGLSMGDLIFPKGTKMFELNGTPCKGTLWETRVVFYVGMTKNAHLSPLYHRHWRYHDKRGG